jgi:membrane protein
MILERFQAELLAFYRQVNLKTHGTLEIWRNAFLRFNRVQGMEAAAAVAYYAIFSIFPLLLTLISLAGFLLSRNQAVELVLEFVAQVIPVDPPNLETTLRALVDQRDISGVIGLAGLLLAGSGVFKTLVRNINRAWPEARKQNMVRSQLLPFGLIAILPTLMILWVIWSSLTSILVARDYPLLERYVPVHQLANPFGRLFPLFAAFILFFIIYYWTPNTRVRWVEAFWGALTASLAWWLLTLGFTWFINSGFVNYDSLYGSLGTSIALLTWVFASTLIILFGAHLSASISRAASQAKQPEGG